MGLIANEVNFLKEFRKRFDTYANYKAALGDLLDAGLITASAYNKVTKKSSIVKPKVITKEVIRSIKKKSPQKRQSSFDYIDSCGHDRRVDNTCSPASTFRSSCDSRKSNC